MLDSHDYGPAKWLVRHDLPLPVVLLTPAARCDWGFAESRAAQAGMIVLPADDKGLAALARLLLAEELEPRPIFAGDAYNLSLATRLQAERFTWLSEVEPASAECEGLINELRSVLSPKEYYLLVAIAAFPEVRLDLMATLDHELHGADQAGQLRERLVRLGRLVWLKEGSFPDWLRTRLLDSMTTPERRRLREAWLTILERPNKAAKGARLLLHPDQASPDVLGAADGIFLGFLRGPLDLPAPRVWSKLAPLWRLPDRLEILVLVGALALTLSQLPPTEILKAVFWTAHAWRELVIHLQDFASIIGFGFLKELGKTAAVGFLMIAMVIFVGLRTGRFAWILPFSNRLLLLLGLLTVASGWIASQITFTDRSSVMHSFADSIATLIIALSILGLRMIPRSPSQKKPLIIEDILESRGTGLADAATIVTLFWLLLVGGLGVVLVTLSASELPQQAVPHWIREALLVLAGVLGLLRAFVISFSGARLQPALPPAVALIRPMLLGVLGGHIAGAATFWMIWSDLPITLKGGFSSPDTALAITLSEFHARCSVQQLGGSVGLLVALWYNGLARAGHIPVFGALIVLPQAAIVALLTVTPSIGIWVAVLPWMLSASLIFLQMSGRIYSNVSGAFVMAMGAMALGSILAILLANGGGYVPDLGDLPVQFVSAIGMIAAWPLLQRAVTHEPSPDREPPGWRARPIAREAWVIAPVLLGIPLIISIGPLRIDFATLAIPLGIWLGWQFGLRGWRAALLMGLAFVSPLRVPGLFEPALDMAVLTLVLSALFARPELLDRVRAMEELPISVALLIAAALSLGVDLELNEFLGWRWLPDRLLVFVCFALGISRISIKHLAIVPSVAALNTSLGWAVAFSSLGETQSAVALFPLPPQSVLAGALAVVAGRALARLPEMVRDATGSDLDSRLVTVPA
jgi:hypothetical protein